jgi:hypothetical protein
VPAKFHYDHHQHPSPGILELSDFDLYDNREAHRLAREMFPDLPPKLRNQLWHSGYCTRESVARATDTELRHYVHSWGLVADALGLAGWRALRAAIPYEPKPE